MAAEAGSLQVIPFLLDGDGFHYHVIDQSNVFGGLVIEGEEAADPVAMIIPPPNWSGRELKAVQLEESTHATSAIEIVPYLGARGDLPAVREDFALGLGGFAESLHCDAKRLAKSLTRVALGDEAVMGETACKTRYGDRDLVIWAIYGAGTRVVIIYAVVGPSGHTRIDRARALGPFTTEMLVR